jgi:mRNA interferase MazF
MHNDRSFSIASRKDQTPLDVITCRALERTPLEARNRHGVVLDCLDQVHFSVTHQTMHHAHSEHQQLPAMFSIAGRAVSGRYHVLVSRQRPLLHLDARVPKNRSTRTLAWSADLAAPVFRVTIEPTPENGLRLKSQVMADTPVTVRRERIGPRIGRIGNQDMARLGIALAFVLGLAD